MRWMKHMTAAWQDEKVARLTDEGGIEAYGFYWRMLEIVAANMTETSAPVCQLPAKSWARLCNLLGNRFERLSNLLAKCGLCRLESFEGLLKVEFPNLVKYRDEYSGRKVKGVSKNRESIGSESGECREQEQIQKQSQIQKQNTDKKTKHVLPLVEEVIPKNIQTPEFIAAWSDWKRYRSEIKHKLTPSTANALLRKFGEWGQSRAIAAINYTIEMGWQGIREPSGKKNIKQTQEDRDAMFDRLIAQAKEESENGSQSSTGNTEEVF